MLINGSYSIINEIIAVNIVLALLKIVSGHVFKSVSLISDGLNSLSDLITNILVIIGLKVGENPEDKEHPFGHGKIESVFSVIIGTFIMITAFNIIKENFFQRKEKIEAPLKNIAEKEKIDITDDFLDERKGFVDLIENNIKGNITYFNKVGNINESMFYFKAIEDREKIINENLDNENINFKISVKIPKKKEKNEKLTLENTVETKEISYQEFLNNKRENDKAKIELGFNSTIYEKKEKSQTESEDFKKNLRPTLPLIKVKLFVIPDDNSKNNLKMFSLENNNDLLDMGSEFKGKKPSLILNTPSLLEKAYKHSKELSEKIEIEKDITNCLEKSVETNSFNEKVFSQIKLKENIKNCFVDENINKMVTKDSGLHYKLTKNMVDKILDKNGKLYGRKFFKIEDPELLIELQRLTGIIDFAPQASDFQIKELEPTK